MLNEKCFEDLYHMLILQKKDADPLSWPFPPHSVLQPRLILCLSGFAYSGHFQQVARTACGLRDWAWCCHCCPMMERVLAVQSFLYHGLVIFHRVAIAPLFTCPSVGVSLGYFHVFSARNNSTVQTCGQASLGDYDFSFLGYIPGNGFLGYLAIV